MPSLENRQENRQEIIACIRRWGGLASDAALDPTCQYFSLSHIDGLIAYRQEYGCAVVLGDPICAASDMPPLAEAFHRFCQEHRKRLIYLAVSHAFIQWAIQNGLKIAIEFGEELVLDPHHDPRAQTGGHASLVRQKVRHALKENLMAMEYRDHDANLENAMKQISQAWLRARHGPQVHISHLCLFANRLGKRWFYASQGERIVGVLLMNQLQAHQGWLINRVIVPPYAPHGTPELLITTALETLVSEGCHFVTFGVVPRPALGKIVGLGTCGIWLSRCLYKCAKKVFYLGGTKTFWEKFHPQNQPSYLLFNGNTIGIRDLFGLIRAVNATF